MLCSLCEIEAISFFLNLTSIFNHSSLIAVIQIFLLWDVGFELLIGATRGIEIVRLSRCFYHFWAIV